MLRRSRKQVSFGADASAKRCDDFFSNRVERRVGYLSELLHEVVEKKSRTVADGRDWCVAAHRTERFCAGARHRSDEYPEFFFGVAKGSLASVHRRCGVRHVFALW